MGERLNVDRMRKYAGLAHRLRLQALARAELVYLTEHGCTRPIVVRYKATR